MVKVVDVRGRDGLYNDLVELTRAEGYEITDEIKPREFNVRTEKGNINVTLYDRTSPDRYAVRTFYQEDYHMGARLAGLYENRTSLEFSLIKDEKDEYDLNWEKQREEDGKSDKLFIEDVDRLEALQVREHMINVDPELIAFHEFLDEVE